MSAKPYNLTDRRPPALVEVLRALLKFDISRGPIGKPEVISTYIHGKARVEYPRISDGMLSCYFQFLTMEGMVIRASRSRAFFVDVARCDKVLFCLEQKTLVPLADDETAQRELLEATWQAAKAGKSTRSAPVQPLPAAVMSSEETVETIITSLVGSSSAFRSIPTAVVKPPVSSPTFAPAVTEYKFAAYLTPAELELHLFFGVESRITSVSVYPRVTLCRESSGTNGRKTVEQLARQASCSVDDICAAIARFAANRHVFFIGEEMEGGCRIIEVHYTPAEVMDVPFGTEPTDPESAAKLLVLKGFERERTVVKVLSRVPAADDNLPPQFDDVVGKAPMLVDDEVAPPSTTTIEEIGSAVRMVYIVRQVFLKPDEARCLFGAFTHPEQEIKSFRTWFSDGLNKLSRMLRYELKLFRNISGRTAEARFVPNMGEVEQTQFCPYGTGPIGIGGIPRRLCEVDGESVPADQWRHDLEAIAAMTEPVPVEKPVLAEPVLVETPVPTPAVEPVPIELSVVVPVSGEEKTAPNTRYIFYITPQGAVTLLLADGQHGSIGWGKMNSSVRTRLMKLGVVKNKGGRRQSARFYVTDAAEHWFEFRLSETRQRHCYMTVPGSLPRTSGDWHRDLERIVARARPVPAEKPVPVVPAQSVKTDVEILTVQVFPFEAALILEFVRDERTQGVSELSYRLGLALKKGNFFTTTGSRESSVTVVNLKSVAAFRFVEKDAHGSRNASRVTSSRGQPHRLQWLDDLEEIAAKATKLVEPGPVMSLPASGWVGFEETEGVEEEEEVEPLDISLLKDCELEELITRLERTKETLEEELRLMKTELAERKRRAELEVKRAELASKLAEVRRRKEEAAAEAERLVAELASLG